MKTFLATAFILQAFSLEAATLNGFEPALYGFIKTSCTYANEGLASFNNINLSAPTHAVAQTRSSEKDSRFSFQAQQSRIGTIISKGSNLTGKLEFDFIDFNKSSPTTQMNPRVRIASITYKKEDSVFILGQDWDLFSPITAYTFDIVGLYFLAGNTGFIRQQFQYLHTLNEWELGAAIGMAGNNPGTSDTDLETSKSPSFSARISKIIPKGRVGLSGIFSSLSYDSLDKRRRESFGLNAFYEQILSSLSIKFEAYYGKNLANIGALSIGKGTAYSDAKEFGGNITIQKALAEDGIIFGGIGVAKVDNKSSIAPFSLSATNIITNPGVLENFVSRLGYEHKITDDFSWISEISRYQTISRISTTKEQLNIVGAVETGVILKF